MGSKGSKSSLKTRKKISENHADFSGKNNPMFGKKRPQYVKDAIAKANKRRIWTEEMRKNHGDSCKGKKQTVAWIKKRIIKGKDHYRWKGGITSQNEKIRHSIEYKKWRNAVFKRDNYTCQKCGARNKKGLGKTLRLEADHIKSFALYPSLRFSVKNGRTLCVKCHKRPGRIPYG